MKLKDSRRSKVETMEKNERKIRLSKQHTKVSAELKPGSPLPDEADLVSLDEKGQERVTEKLSIPIPVQPLQRPTGVMAYAGQRVRLLLRDGSIIVGFLQKRIFNFIHLLNIQEIGKDFKITADWIDIEIGTIARIYPATAQAETISRPQG